MPAYYSNTLFLVILFLSVSSLNAQTNSVNEEKFVAIGGIDQWVTINGADKTKPVILFIHGGPGSVSSPYEQDPHLWRMEKRFYPCELGPKGCGKNIWTERTG